MTGETDDTDDGRAGSISRRGILGGIAKGIGGVGVGLGVGAGGILVLDRETDHVDLGPITKRAGVATGLSAPEQTPRENAPEDPDSPRDTPWDQNTVRFTIERSDNLAGFDYVPEGLRNAAAFWNDYVDANEGFDLTLSFEPDAADPDIRFVEENIMHCFGEYRSPATENEGLTAYVCVETLTERPENTPVEVDISIGGGGDAVYEFVATHALGRLIGYDVWDDPVDVMTPKILFGPAHTREHPGGGTILGRPSGGGMFSERFPEQMRKRADTLRNATAEHIEVELESHRESLRSFLDGHHEDMGAWTREVEEMGFPLYAEAYEETVRSDEIAYLEETLSLLTDLVENYTAEEIVDSEELDALVARYERIGTWNETVVPFDLQIHRYWADAVWSEWTSA